MSDIKRVIATVRHLVIYPDEGHQVDWESIRDQCLSIEKELAAKDAEIERLNLAYDHLWESCIDSYYWIGQNSKLEGDNKLMREALEFIAPMEQDEEFPATRISKASKRARQALVEIDKMKGV